MDLDLDAVLCATVQVQQRVVPRVDRDRYPTMLFSKKASFTPDHAGRKKRRSCRRRCSAHLLSLLPEVDAVIGSVEVVDVDPRPAVGLRQDDLAVETCATSSQHHHWGAYLGWKQKGRVKGGRQKGVERGAGTTNFLHKGKTAVWGNRERSCCRAMPPRSGNTRPAGPAASTRLTFSWILRSVFDGVCY